MDGRPESMWWPTATPETAMCMYTRWGPGGDPLKVKDLMVAIYRAGIALGGTISGEHGLGYEKKGYLHLAASPGKLALYKRIKQAFDPHNIMNPGKVLE